MATKKQKKSGLRLRKKNNTKKVSPVKNLKKRKKTQKRIVSKKVKNVKKVKKVKNVGKIKKHKKINKAKPIKKRKIVKKVAKIIGVKKKKRIKRNNISDSDFHKTKIRLIGIGGGGGSIVSELALKMSKLDFVVANTDTQALKKTPKKVKRFQFGQDLTNGFGAGMNPEIGRMAAENKKEDIEKLFEGQDVCILVASLGGGTGSGALPVFSKISKNLNCITYGIFTLPFEFEGEKKMEISKESLEQVKQNLNAYSIIPNERIFRIVDKNAPLKSALSSINKKLTENLQGLIEMIHSSGLINIDFADLRTILSGKGKLVYLNTVETKMLNNVKDDSFNNRSDLTNSQSFENQSLYNFQNNSINRESNNISAFSSQNIEGAGIIKKLIFSELYPYNIKGSKGILYNISSDKALQLLEVSLISKAISESINKNAKIIFGINQNEKLKNKIKITLLAVGCGMKKDLPEIKAENKNIIPKRKKLKRKIKNKKKSDIRKNEPKEIESIQPPVREKHIIIDKEIKEEKLKKKEKTEIKKLPVIKNKKVLLKKIEENSEQGNKLKSNLASVNETKVEVKTVLPKIRRAITEEEKRRNLTELKEIEDKKVRRSGLQVKEAAEEEEKEILKKEEIWEVPAIFRRKKE